MPVLSEVANSKVHSEWTQAFNASGIYQPDTSAVQITYLVIFGALTKIHRAWIVKSPEDLQFTNSPVGPVVQQRENVTAVSPLDPVYRLLRYGC